MKRPWIEPPRLDTPEKYRRSIGGHPIVAETMYRRGLVEIHNAWAFLDPAFYTPAPSLELPGVEKAVVRLWKAFREGDLICVWGDFDVDGQTATTLFVTTLRELGAQVIYHIPIRAEESHGINIPALKVIIETHPVRVLLTCDTGITAHEAVEYARKKNIDVIITDHHDLPQKLPDATAIISPRLLDNGHKLENLPGVGVAFKLAQELYRMAGREESCNQFLDLVALGIVADMARLEGETRYLLQLGIKILRNPQRLGFQVVMELAGLSPTFLSEEHIGYVLAPRLNAIGRLADANPVVELLTTNDKGRARLIAHQLEGYNARRQLLTNQVYQGAIAQIDKDPSLIELPVLVLSNPNWPPGVIGIVANRLVERYQKPTILISTLGGEIGRGSARSVEGINITEAIASQQDKLINFGGHPMAAGFGIHPDQVYDFRLGLIDVVGKSIPLPLPPRSIDGYISFADISLDLAMEVERLAPFGPGNPPLVLCTRGIKVVNQVSVGRGKEHLLLTVEDEMGVNHRVIWWQGVERLGEKSLPEGYFDLAYTLRTSTHKGQRDLSLEWIDYRQSEASINVQPISEIEMVDYRGISHPIAELKKLRDQVQIWAEGPAFEKLNNEDWLNVTSVCVKSRYLLIPTHTLVIWTIPPGRGELFEALLNAKPQRVLCFGINPEVDSIDSFIKRLAGLIKYASTACKGNLEVNKLSEAMAHRKPTIKKGIEWLTASGYINILDVIPDGFIVQLASDRFAITTGESTKLGQVNSDLLKMLEETSAFRAYYLRAHIDSLIS
jgi:single-stranded-DNA-specific exonuclease